MTVVKCLTCENTFVTATKLKDKEKKKCPICYTEGTYIEAINPVYKGEGSLLADLL